MYLLAIVQALIGFLVSTIAALPHEQMMNDEFHRDVGVLYPNHNFTGTPFYLVQHKKGPKCETNITGVSVASAQICMSATCIFYDTDDCTFTKPNSARYYVGPADVDNLQPSSNHTCNSYMCGTVEEMGHMVADIASASTSEGKR